MLRLLALLLPLLPPPARAREPSAQDVSLGVVSAGVRGLLDLQGSGRGKPGPGLPGSEEAGGGSSVQRVTGDGDRGPELLDPSGGSGPEFGNLERGYGREVGTLGNR